MTEKFINEDEVISFLDSWKNGVVSIGQTYTENNDFVSVAKDFISTHYNFTEGEVLFKPTFTKQVIFRNNQEDALSYFVKGGISEDSGFAIKPWEKIDLIDINIIIENGYCFCMGVFDLFPLSKDEITKVAFTFILVKDANDSLKIKVHHSSPII